MMDKILVCGAGGFIPHHLVAYLKKRGYWVRGVDIKAPEWESSLADEFEIRDLRYPQHCEQALRGGVTHVYQLAANMGGIGYITESHAQITADNTLINSNMITNAYNLGVERYFFSSSACVYPQYLQKNDLDTPLLKESDAYPAEPEEGYGLEKLYAEKLCEYFYQDFGFETRIARFHNVYGPLGTYEGGREKAPAAISRKIALAQDKDTIEVWGDGHQTRSFMHVDDCVEGIFRIMNSTYAYPLNLGSDEVITVNGLVDLIAGIAGKEIQKQHDTSKPQGVRARNSDNRLCRQTLGWEPEITLADGLPATYQWIRDQVTK